MKIAVVGTGYIVHLRPSGNAPELRIYAESSNNDQASNILKNATKKLIVLDAK